MSRRPHPLGAYHVVLHTSEVHASLAGLAGIHRDCPDPATLELSRLLSSAAAARVPFRVTLHQLRLAPLTLPATDVFVCENPAVLRAAAGRATAPLICTEGVPAAAVHALLSRRVPGTVIRWRNDFDWTGVRLTAAAMARYPEAVPWRMSGADYLAAAALGLPLTGTAAATAWDPSLAAATTDAGRSVMEERLISTLLADIAAL